MQEAFVLIYSYFQLLFFVWTIQKRTRFWRITGEISDTCIKRKSILYCAILWKNSLFTIKLQKVYSNIYNKNNIFENFITISVGQKMTESIWNRPGQKTGWILLIFYVYLCNYSSVWDLLNFFPARGTRIRYTSEITPAMT